MIPIILGTDLETGQKISLDYDLFRTHLHLLGATGTGKTTGIKTILRALLINPQPKCALFLVDPMGNLSHDLLLWMSSERLCPEHVRERLVYIEPAKEDIVLPFNPLLHESPDHLYYQVGRAVEIVLRAWASQNIEEMPRLRHWTFASFFAAAAMGFPLAACQYLLRPGSDEHKALLQRLPAELRFMWSEILQARGNEAIRLLESTRNRLAPFFDSGILRRMFSSIRSRFDVAQFIRERRIVILNVGSYGRLDRHIAHTIGGLAVNEIIQTAMTMPRSEVDPTYLLLDEFQHFVGPDLFDALPIVRQIGLRLILAHQSFTQLERGDVDLSGLIWQARSRLMFANDADDADRIAHELATLTYDPMKLKEVLYTFRQYIAGHRREWLQNTGQSTTTSHAVDEQRGGSTSHTTGQSRAPRQYLPTDSSGDARTESHGRSEKHSDSAATSHGQSETLVPVHENFYEVSSKSYSNFDEQRVEWAKRVRTKKTGEAFGKFKDNPKLYDIAIDDLPIIETPVLLEKKAQLLERNFASDVFASKADVERQADELRQALLSGGHVVLDATTTGRLPGPHTPSSAATQNQPSDVQPFR